MNLMPWEVLSALYGRIDLREVRPCPIIPGEYIISRPKLGLLGDGKHAIYEENLSIKTKHGITLVEFPKPEGWPYHYSLAFGHAAVMAHIDSILDVLRAASEGKDVTLESAIVLNSIRSTWLEATGFPEIDDYDDESDQ